MNCPNCQSQEVVKNGRLKRQDGSVVQKYLCKACTKQFNARTGTPMCRLRTSSLIVSAALNVRTEGLGIRATGRAFGKSHFICYKGGNNATSQQSAQWSPPAPTGADVTQTWR